MFYCTNNIATVFPSSFYKSDLCLHCFGGNIPLFAKIIATVQPSSFCFSGLLLLRLGIIPNNAKLNIDVVVF